MSGPKCKLLIFSVLPILNIDATYRHEHLYGVTITGLAKTPHGRVQDNTTSLIATA